MKYCSQCGNQLVDEAVICPKCGCATGKTIAVAQETAPAQESGLKIAAKVLMVISTVVLGLYIIPLAWCIPMTVTYFNKVKRGEPVSTGFKICCLLFVNLIAGILMLVDEDNK